MTQVYPRISYSQSAQLTAGNQHGSGANQNASSTSPVRVSVPQAEGGQIDEMAGKVVALNRRAFHRRLRELTREYRAPLTSGEIRAIVQSRNSLVHLAKFATDDH